MSRPIVTIDGNEAAAWVAHHTNEVIAIYPITPSSNMGEWADQWSAEGKRNIWGTIPEVIEMQSEAGASAAVHGALQTGALTTTFTAAQGLLLMIPTMFKVAGELTPTVWHVSARTVATHALSIFGDHSDIMAVRSTGFGLLASNSVQEVMDTALIAQAASLEARVPFVHFFDGFRVSHEVQKIEQLTAEDMRAMLPEEAIFAHRRRAMNPNQPVLRGTSQNPDVFFQARERLNPYFDACPEIVQKHMDNFAKLVGRQYHLFDYVGHPDADRIIIMMGSGAEAAEEYIDWAVAKGEKIGMVKVRLFRPFSVSHFIGSLPKTLKQIAVLDRTKEPGSEGEPLYKDVVTAVAEALADGVAPFKTMPRIIGGRYGLSSKEFTPAMVKAIFDELGVVEAKRRFTVGIDDDVTNLSLDYDHSFSVEGDDVFRGLFYGLGADGTVGANKNSIKIIGGETDNYAQGYFVYDSKKSGTITVSHLRFGRKPIKSSYLINRANFVACSQTVFLEKYDMLNEAIEGAIFLLNTYVAPDKVWHSLPARMQKQILDKKIRLYVIDAYKVAAETGMGERVNTIMQTCFFAIAGILPRDEAIAQIKKSIKKTYGAKGDKIVEMNFNAVDKTLDNLHAVKIPTEINGFQVPPPVTDNAPQYVKDVLGSIIAFKGDQLPVSAFADDGTFPTATAQFEKRNIALEIPIWKEDLCTQCGKCVLACPHAAIRQKVYDPALLTNAPATFKSADYKAADFKGLKYTLQVAAEDCTGCGLCVEFCPVHSKTEVKIKAINMESQPPIRESERENYSFFLDIPEVDRRLVKVGTVKGSQFLRPLFEYSGACSGCGETPYVKLVSQLFGDRAIIGNATGCSSIYGGNLPTTPWAKNAEGRGPTWNNSLFEDAAEFSYGFRLTLDKHREYAVELMDRLRDSIGGELVDAIKGNPQNDEADIYDQREHVEKLKAILPGIAQWEARHLFEVADALVKKSVWGMGGDGWAYDIGYGGLDHVLASGRNINLLVLDTGVYSNTGGQCSKATPLGAVAKFAASGKGIPRKDLGMMAIAYGHVYVAQIAMGANDTQTVKAILEAERYNGPSLIIAYSHCIAHGIEMAKGMTQQELAVKSGMWPLYRYNPDLAKEGKNPLSLDSKPPSIPVEEYTMSETRFRMLTRFKPDRAKDLLKGAQENSRARFSFYEQLAAMNYGNGNGEEK
jgi:pyruvate-ferredoxin/flavodoxin oxidoreductase